MLTEPPDGQKRDVPLVERRPDPVQRVPSGAVGARPAHQRTQQRHHRLAAAHHPGVAAAAGHQTGHGRHQRVLHVFAADQRPDHQNPQVVHGRR